MMASAFVICLLLICLLACCQVTSGQHCMKECTKRLSRKVCRPKCSRILSNVKTPSKRKEMHVTTENKREKDKISGEIAAIARLLRISLQKLAKTNQEDKDHDTYSIL